MILHPTKFFNLILQLHQMIIIDIPEENPPTSPPVLQQQDFHISPGKNTPEIDALSTSTRFVIPEVDTHLTTRPKSVLHLLLSD